MLKLYLNQTPHVVLDVFHNLNSLPVAVEVQTDRELDHWLSNLSLDTPWGNRKIAAHKLGSLRNPDAIPALLEALVFDPFWMVRFAVIQALEMIGDPEVIPALQKAAQEDHFQVVRSYAIKAMERLSVTC